MSHLFYRRFQNHKKTGEKNYKASKAVLSSFNEPGVFKPGSICLVLILCYISLNWSSLGHQMVFSNSSHAHGSIMSDFFWPVQSQLDLWSNSFWYPFFLQVKNIRSIVHLFGQISHLVHCFHLWVSPISDIILWIVLGVHGWFTIHRLPLSFILHLGLSIWSLHYRTWDIRWVQVPVSRQTDSFMTCYSMPVFIFSSLRVVALTKEESDFPSFLTARVKPLVIFRLGSRCQPGAIQTFSFVPGSCSPFASISWVAAWSFMGWGQQEMWPYPA